MSRTSPLPGRTRSGEGNGPEPSAGFVDLSKAEGSQMKPYPTHRQREALQILMPGDWMPLRKLLPIGDKALATVLQRGWIEQSSDVNAGNLYRVTNAGRTAFRTPVPIRYLKRK